MPRSVALKLGMCLLTLSLAVGCATTAKGPSDEEQIKAQLSKWKDALEAKNVDAMMVVHSESFQSAGRNKAEYREYVQGAVEEGYLDDAKVDLEGAAITVDKDKATVGPVSLEGSRGGIDLDLELSKENGQWLITSVSEA